MSQLYKPKELYVIAFPPSPFSSEKKVWDNFVYLVTRTGMFCTSYSSLTMRLCDRKIEVYNYETHDVYFNFSNTTIETDLMLYGPMRMVVLGVKALSDLPNALEIHYSMDIVSEDYHNERIAKARAARAEAFRNVTVKSFTLDNILQNLLGYVYQESYLEKIESKGIVSTLSRLEYSAYGNLDKQYEKDCNTFTFDVNGIKLYNNLIEKVTAYHYKDPTSSIRTLFIYQVHMERDSFTKELTIGSKDLLQKCIKYFIDNGCELEYMESDSYNHWSIADPKKKGVDYSITVYYGIHCWMDIKVVFPK